MEIFLFSFVKVSLNRMKNIMSEISPINESKELLKANSKRDAGKKIGIEQFFWIGTIQATYIACSV